MRTCSPPAFKRSPRRLRFTASAIVLFEAYGGGRASALSKAKLGSERRAAAAYLLGRGRGGASRPPPRCPRDRRERWCEVGGLLGSRSAGADASLWSIRGFLQVWERNMRWCQAVGGGLEMTPSAAGRAASAVSAVSQKCCSLRRYRSTDIRIGILINGHPNSTDIRSTDIRI